jgi:hypothetical protein
MPLERVPLEFETDGVHHEIHGYTRMLYNLIFDPTCHLAIVFTQRIKSLAYSLRPFSSQNITPALSVPLYSHL